MLSNFGSGQGSGKIIIEYDETYGCTLCISEIAPDCDRLRQIKRQESPGRKTCPGGRQKSRHRMDCFSLIRRSTRYKTLPSSPLTPSGSVGLAAASARLDAFGTSLGGLRTLRMSTYSRVIQATPVNSLYLYCTITADFSTGAAMRAGSYFSAESEMVLT